MRVLPRHDVFVVYSQAEAQPLRLVRALYDGLAEVGFTLPGYEEMDWTVEAPETKVNTPMLQAYYGQAKCVIVMARRLSAGVAVELETLAKQPSAPPVLSLTWGREGVGHEAVAPFVKLRIARWHDRDATLHARRLRGWVWLCVVLNDLLALGPFGHWVIRDLMQRSRAAAAVVVACRRFAPALTEAAVDAGAPRRGRRVLPVLPAGTLTRADALAVWRYWNGGAALISGHVLRDLPGPLSGTLGVVQRRLNALCADLDKRFPGAMVLDAKSRAAATEARYRVGAAVPSPHDADAAETDPGAEGDERFRHCMMSALQHAQAPATAEQALHDFAAALRAAEDAGLALHFRHNTLVRRAELLINMERPNDALADLDEVVAAGADADEYARFSAHYLRGGARYRLGQWDRAIEDYGAVVEDRRAPEATRLSARLRRGAAYSQAGNLAAARADYRAVLADTRAAESTRRSAQRNLDDLAGRD